MYYRSRKNQHPAGCSILTSLTVLYHKSATIRRCAFFSLVTGPALAIFIAFVCLSFSGSPSAQLLDAVRNIIDGAPVGKLLVCANESISTTPPTPVVTPCLREAVDESTMTALWDQTFRMFYLVSAALAFAIWCIVNKPKRK